MLIGDCLGSHLFGWPKIWSSLLGYLSGEIDHSLTMAAMIGVLGLDLRPLRHAEGCVLVGANSFAAYYLPRKLQQVDEAQHRIEKNRSRKHHSIMFPPPNHRNDRPLKHDEAPGYSQNTLDLGPYACWVQAEISDYNIFIKTELK